MERIMVNCAANLSRPGLILLSPFFCRWVLDWQKNEGRRMSGGGFSQDMGNRWWDWVLVSMRVIRVGGFGTGEGTSEDSVRVRRVAFVLRIGLFIASFLGSFRRLQPLVAFFPWCLTLPVLSPLLPASMAGRRSRPWIHAGTR